MWVDFGTGKPISATTLMGIFLMKLSGNTSIA